MYSLILLLLISYVQAQQSICSCSCCVGQFCNPIDIGVFYLQSCTSESCRTSCRNTFTECQQDYPNGQVVPQCSSTTTLYNCQCDCCRTGISACTPTLVGYSAAYTCQTSSCSIYCARQYPAQCVADQSGQTIGTCIGMITTTTTTTVSTTSRPSSGNTCSCLCCQSGPSCSPNIEVGIATGVGLCSSTVCTTACQNQYPMSCPSSSYVGYTNGVCTSPNSGNTRCRCQCCGIVGCPTHDVNTYADCTSCPSLCQQRCGNTNPTTYTCASNKSIKSTPSSLLLFIFLSLVISSLYSIF
jgi:hypothetical protein